MESFLHTGASFTVSGADFFSGSEPLTMMGNEPKAMGYYSFEIVSADNPIGCN
jgi:hypothetical protein